MLCAAASAWAQIDGPPKAPELRGYFVTAYEECVEPNAKEAESFGGDMVGCSPPVRSDDVCGFGTGGFGKFSLTVSRRGLKVAAKLVGLNDGCEGETLRLAVTGRVTTEACTPARCTLTDAASRFVVPAGPCLVRAGVCKTGGSFPVEDLPQAIVHLGVGDVSVYRGDVRTFTGGISIPAGQRSP